MPVNQPGPWALDKVKKRLRAEQVQREKAASASSKVQTAGTEGIPQRRKDGQDKCVSVQSSCCPHFVLHFVVNCCPGFV